MYSLQYLELYESTVAWVIQIQDPKQNRTNLLRDYEDSWLSAVIH